MQKGRRVHISSRVELWWCLHRGEFFLTMVFIPLCDLDRCGEIFAWSLLQLLSIIAVRGMAGVHGLLAAELLFSGFIFFILEYHVCIAFMGTCVYVQVGFQDKFVRYVRSIA